MAKTRKIPLRKSLSQEKSLINVDLLRIVKLKMVRFSLIQQERKMAEELYIKLDNEEAPSQKRNELLTIVFQWKFLKVFTMNLSPMWITRSKEES